MEAGRQEAPDVAAGCTEGSRPATAPPSAGWVISVLARSASIRSVQRMSVGAPAKRVGWSRSTYYRHAEALGTSA